jgi:CheY-like chemotaxis protein
MSNKISILWADDEADLLKSQILFLTDKGYTVTTVSNGHDALDSIKENAYDVIFLDENMPGISGIETLGKLKEINPHIPVVMITKSEEENLMEDAIGSQIADYLIKPVKPNQILLSLKKLIDNKRLISEKTTTNYRQEFLQMLGSIGSSLSPQEWIDAYKKIVYWELELDKNDSREMQEVMSMQKTEANSEFCKYVIKNYTNWTNKPDNNSPIMSNQALVKKVLPYLSNEMPTFLVLIDNLRFDQWRMIQPLLNDYFRLLDEDAYFAILPTATQYARNSLFAGLMPSEIEKKFPNKWLNDEEEGGKNLHEHELLEELLKHEKKNIKFSYTKITNHRDGSELENNILNNMHLPLNVIVYNFIDMLSHARTEMEVLKELANDEKALRSLTYSWFNNSPLLNALKKLQGKNVQLIITTDHGSIRVNNPSKVIADRQTTTNLRYKTGKSMQFNPKECLEIKNPLDGKLPKQHISSSFIFAKEDYFFVYANNFNHFANFYKNSFQHGGLSIEEVIVPMIRMVSK